MAGPEYFGSARSYELVRLGWLPALVCSVFMGVFAGLTAAGVLPLGSLRVVGRDLSVSYRVGLRRRVARFDLDQVVVTSVEDPVQQPSAAIPTRQSAIVFADGSDRVRIDTVFRVTPQTIERVNSWIAERKELEPR